MTLAQQFSCTVHDLWQTRVKCYTALIWWVALRYFATGLECVFGLHPHSHSFGGISFQCLGAWMVVTGALGIASQIISWRTHLMCPKLVMVFAVTISIHALFRMAVLAQTGLLFDPMFMLFLCDFGAMSLILIGIPHKKQIIAC